MPYKKESMLMGGDASNDTSTQLCFNPPEGPFDASNVVEGSIGYVGDEDWIAIKLTEGNMYTITTGGGDSSEGELNDSVLKLMDSKGGLIMMNDDKEAAEGDLSSEIEFTPEAGSGTQVYFISVSGYTGNPGAMNTGSYTVNVKEVALLPAGEGADIQAMTGADHKLIGTANGESIAGMGGNDTIYAGGGDDTLSGGGGNDLLMGGPGADDIKGGDGNDTVSYKSSAEGVTINLLSGQANGGDAEGDTLAADIENIQGSMHDDMLTGGDEANKIWGLAGNDTLDGGEDDDTLEGGYGADTLIGGEGTDTASYSMSAMGVSVRLHSGQAMGGDAMGDTWGELVEATYFNAEGDPVDEMVPDIENLTGSANDDILAGDSRDNVLMGLAGNDKLYGGPGGGNDMLHGGLGNDMLFGGKGDDRLYGNDGDDMLNGGAGADRFDGGDGDDMIYADGDDTSIKGGDGTDTVSYARLEDTPGAITLGADIENAVGSQDDDTITGNTMNNVIEGGEGGDAMTGGGGVDTLSYAGSDDWVRVTLLDAAATDGNWIDASRGHASGDSVTAADVTTQTFMNLMGSAHDDDLTGDARANSLMGGAGDDELTGNGGDDTIEGGAGADTMDGGDESNTADMNDWLSYAGSDAGVTINLARALADGGHATGDEIITAEEEIDGEDVDVSTFEHVRGSAHDDNLTGDHRDNMLDGGGGADDLDGGMGTDTATYANAKMEGITIDLGSSRGTGGEADGDTYSNIEKFMGSGMDDTFVAGRGHDTVDGGDQGDDGDTISYEKSRAGVTVNLTTQVTAAADNSGADVPGAWRYLANNLDKFYVDGSNVDADAGQTDTDNARDSHEMGFDTLEELLTALTTTEDDGIDAAEILIDDGGLMNDGGTPDDTSDDTPINDVAVSTMITAARSADPAGFGTTAADITNLYGDSNDRADLRNNYNKGDILDNIENVIGSDHDDVITGNSVEDDTNTADVNEAMTSGNMLQGGDGDDNITGGAGDDTIHGGDGTDDLMGLAGNDTLMGGADRDKLIGDAGNDTLNGGVGDDDLTGDTAADGSVGRDIFVFGKDGAGTDTIIDFNTAAGGTGVDKIDLRAFDLEHDTLVDLIEVRGSNTVIDLSGHGGGKIIISGLTDLTTLYQADDANTADVDESELLSLVTDTAGGGDAGTDPDGMLTHVDAGVFIL